MFNFLLRPSSIGSVSIKLYQNVFIDEKLDITSVVLFFEQDRFENLRSKPFEGDSFYLKSDFPSSEHKATIALIP